MAPEYLLTIVRDKAQLAAVASWLKERLGLTPAFAEGRIAVFARGTTIPVAIGTSGYVIGTLFHRFGPPRAIETLDDTESRRIVESGGSELIDRFWGGYVAVIDHGNMVQIIRDPSGALPSYHADFEDGIIFASDACMLAAAGLTNPSPSWPALGRGLYLKDFPSDQTALQGVSELLPGTALTLCDEHRSTRQLWSPWDYITRGDEAREEQVQHVRRNVQTAVSAWASIHQSLLCAVSGGLDSSIVAACLEQTSRKPVLLTISTAEPDGDEAFFAQMLADALGQDLCVEALDLTDILIDRAAAPHLPRPVSRTQSLSYDAIVARVAAGVGADCLFTGNGGDNVFAFSHSATSIYDRFRGEGLGFGLLRTLNDVCSLTGCSPWQAIASAWKVARRPTPSYQWKPDPEFLHPELIAANSREHPAHPWLVAPGDALPGKAAHIALLLRIQQHLQASERSMGLPVVNPLMSQPVIETCLPIPSWEWCAGGVNRSLAREAFAMHLPTPLIRRRSKGTPESFCVAIIETHRDAIRERLVDGCLAAHGLLDIEAVERRLANNAPTLPSTQRLLELVEAEAWARHWIGTNPSKVTTLKTVRAPHGKRDSVQEERRRAV